jgi:hypothetical protein
MIKLLKPPLSQPTTDNSLTVSFSTLSLKLKIHKWIACGIGQAVYTYPEHDQQNNRNHGLLPVPFK